MSTKVRRGKPGRIWKTQCKRYTSRGLGRTCRGYAWAGVCMLWVGANCCNDYFVCGKLAEKVTNDDHSSLLCHNHELSAQIVII